MNPASAQQPHTSGTSISRQRPAWVEACILTTLCLLLTVAFFSRVVLTHDRTFIADQDAVDLYFPWMSKVGHDWRSLHAPLWDFSSDAGVPFPGEMCTGAFYPINIIYVMLAGQPTPRTLDWLMAGHFAFGMLGMSLFLRRRGLGTACSLLGGAVFAWTGPMAARASAHQMIFEATVFLPWVLLCLHRGYHSTVPVWRSLSLQFGGVLLAFSLLCGHPQPFIHNALMVAAYAAFLVIEQAGSGKRRAAIIRAIGAVSCIAIVSFLVSFIQLASSMEYFSRTYRWIGLSEPVRALDTVPFSAYNLFKLQWADLRGIFQAVFSIPDVGTIHLTLTAVLLAVLGLFARDRWRLFAVSCIIFSFLVALGDNTIFGKLFYHLPLLNKVREPARILYLYQFCIAGLAAYGMSLILARCGKSAAAKAAISCIILGGFATEAYRLDSQFIRQRDYPVTPALQYEKTPLIAFLEEAHARDGGLYRVYDHRRGSIPPNAGLVLHFNNLLGYRSGYLVDFFNLLSQDWSPASKALDALSVRYLIADEADAQAKTLPVVFSSEGKIVVERPDAKPIFRLEHASPASKIEEIAWGHDSVRVALKAENPDRLIFAQTSFPGWKLAVNGTRRKMEKEQIFMAAPVTAGRNVVEWTYRPYWYPLGIGLWILTGVFAVTSLILGRSGGSRQGRP